MSQNQNSTIKNRLKLTLIKMILGWIILISGLIHQLYIVYKIYNNGYFETTISHLYYYISTTWIPMLVGSILLIKTNIEDKS